MTNTAKALFWRVANAVRRLGFDWIDGALTPRPGTCPYPIHDNWSVRRCVGAGECGCDAREIDSSAEDR